MPVEGHLDHRLAVAAELLGQNRAGPFIGVAVGVVEHDHRVLQQSGQAAAGQPVQRLTRRRAGVASPASTNSPAELLPTRARISAKESRWRSEANSQYEPCALGSTRLPSLPNAVSASTATTRSSWRSSANTDPTLADTVVLPTPPLPSTPIL